MWLCGCAAVALGQYHVIPGATDPGEFADCFPKAPARICLGDTGEDRCYALPTDKDYIFGLGPKAEPAGRFKGQELILFSATFSGCGSGTLTSYALLMRKDGEFVNLLPKMELTNQSELRLWSLPSISNLPVVMTADFIWGSGETHFSTHRYVVRTYVFSAATGKYAEKLHYITHKKYPGLDEADDIKVLDAERSAIMDRLR